MSSAWECIGAIVAPDQIVKWDAYDASDKASWSDLMEEYHEVWADEKSRPYLWYCAGGELREIPREEAEKIFAASLVDACEDTVVSLYEHSQAEHWRLPEWLVRHEEDRIYAIHEGITLEEYL